MRAAEDDFDAHLRKMGREGAKLSVPRLARRIGKSVEYLNDLAGRNRRRSKADLKRVERETGFDFTPYMAR